MDNIDLLHSNNYSYYALAKVEKLLFDLAEPTSDIKPIFILGAPRTGSTLLYQAVSSLFDLPYISNLTNNNFADFPIIGLALQRGVNVDISWNSQFGKTDGEFQPSEGSAVMSRWFGGGHPSQDVSTRILEGQEEHFLSTLTSVEALYNGRPLLIKNAWNCFRVSYLINTLPNARFIWIRRDIVDAAVSDLEARYLTKGTASDWNSATPSKWYELKKLPPHMQAVENQFEFNNAIRDALSKSQTTQASEIWYEDIIRAPDIEVHRLARFLGLPVKRNELRVSPNRDDRRKVSKDELQRIRAYVNNHASRFAKHLYNRSGRGK